MRLKHQNQFPRRTACSAPSRAVRGAAYSEGHPLHNFQMAKVRLQRYQPAPLWNVWKIGYTGEGMATIASRNPDVLATTTVSYMARLRFRHEWCLFTNRPRAGLTNHSWDLRFQIQALATRHSNMQSLRDSASAAHADVEPESTELSKPRSVVHKNSCE